MEQLSLDNGPALILLAGKPRSGKSHLLKYLLSMRHPDFADDGIVPYKWLVVFSGTKFNGMFSEIVPEQYIYPKFDAALLGRILARQQAMGCPRMAIIFDDCLPSTGAKGFGSEVFTTLSTQFRHYKCDVIIASQYIYKVPPTVRECATHIAMFRATTGRMIDALYETAGGHFGSAAEFGTFLNESTANHQFIWFYANSDAESRDEIYIRRRAPARIPGFVFTYGPARQ